MGVIFQINSDIETVYFDIRLPVKTAKLCANFHQIIQIWRNRFMPRLIKFCKIMQTWTRQRSTQSPRTDCVCWRQWDLTVMVKFKVCGFQLYIERSSYTTGDERWDFPGRPAFPPAITLTCPGMNPIGC